VLQHDIKKVYPADDVALEIPLGMGHGILHHRLRCQMHHSVDLEAAKDTLQSIRIADVCKDKFSPLRHSFPVPLLEVIQDDDFISFSEELFGNDASYISSATGNQDHHVEATSTGIFFRQVAIR
jgi:hypothetical protein